MQEDPKFSKTGQGMGIMSEMLGDRTIKAALDSQGLEIDTIFQSNFECRFIEECSPQREMGQDRDGSWCGALSEYICPGVRTRDVQLLY